MQYINELTEFLHDERNINYGNAEEDLQPILREEVEIAVASLKKGKSAGVVIYQQNLFKLAGRP